MAAGTAQAAELGELQVRSYIGQPLIADVELLSIAPDEAASLRVRLASPDVYRIANIAMDPALLTVNMSIMRREQRQFLHITSIKPVDANHAVLFLELSGAGRSIVREATAWLAPDPHPAAPPPPADAPSPALIAAMARADMARAAPAAATRAPALPVPQRESASSETPAAAAVHAVATHPAHAPAPVKPALPALVPAPAPAVSAAERQAYIELGRKNAALNRKLGELEGKLKQLQQQVGGHPGVSSGAPNLPETDAVKVAAPAPKPKPLPLKLKALKALPQKKAEPAAGAGPWPWIAGAIGVVLAAAGGYWLVSRRRQPRTPSKYWVLLKKPFGRRKKVVEEAPGVVVLGPAEEAVE